MLFTDRRDAERYANGHRCEGCGFASHLVVRWSHGGQRWEVYCPPCGNGQRFLRNKSVSELWREHPDAVDIATANKLEAKYRR